MTSRPYPQCLEQPIDRRDPRVHPPAFDPRDRLLRDAGLRGRADAGSGPARRRASRTIRPAIDIAANPPDDTNIISPKIDVKPGASSPARPIIRRCPSCAAGSTRRPPRRRANHAAMTALVAELRARTAAVAERGAGGDDKLDRAPSRARQAAGPRADRPPARPGLGVPRAEPARRQRPVRRRGAGRRDRHRHRPGRGHDLRRSSPTTRRSRAAPTTR